VRFLRHVAGYNRRDEISNLTIRSELQILNINYKIKDKKRRNGMSTFNGWTHRIARKAVEYKLIGHRDVGRPKRRWDDDF
jgi:hypothetical protein